jgi:translation initiation factor 2B subunit (eIF-2B alpha/beta/delta family)
MSPILRLASAAVSAALLAVDARQALDAAETAAIRFVDNSASQARAAALHASTMVCAGTSVLTHSRSSTVVEAFFEARRAGRDFSVVATESRPMLEGRALAEALAGEGIRVLLIADSAASLVMDQVDLIFVGADKVTPQYLVNKIGTWMIALAGRERGLRAYAVCDTSKFISKDYFDSPARGERTANELWPDAPPGVRVVNRYFEQTPLTYLTGIITENGFLSSREAARRAEGASLDRVLEDALERYREKC